MATFTFSIYSQALHRSTEVSAIIPAEKPAFPGVPFDPDKPFRAIYLLHGYSGSHRDWLNGSVISQLAQQHRIAVFCPSGENSFYVDEPSRDANYATFICEELVDFTRRVFPLSRERKDTIIGGFSMGGYGAIRNGMKYNETFGSIIALSSALITDGIAMMPDEPGDPPAQGGGMGMSPSYFIHCFGKPSKIKGSDVDPKALASKLMEGDGPRPELYMACGAEDFLIESNRSLHQHLESVGYPHKYTEGPGTHSWEYWNLHITEGLKWLDELDK
ncbi:MAG: acetylesterase [Oscillospiraceae bacterium]|nr:acetylesterase [Oscillospiraceae bacterium]